VGLQKSLVVDPWPQSCRVSGLLFLPPLPFRPPLALTSFAGHLLQFRSQTPEGLDNFFPLLRVAPGTTHGGQLPAVFQPIDQVNARFEVSEVIPQVLDHAVRGSSLLTLLQVFRVKILQAPERHIDTKLRLFRTGVAFEREFGLELLETIQSRDVLFAMIRFGRRMAFQVPWCLPPRFSNTSAPSLETCRSRTTPGQACMLRGRPFSPTSTITF